MGRQGELHVSKRGRLRSPHTPKGNAMNYAPIARIIIRYIVGLVIGADMADTLAGDPDVVTVCALALGAACEFAYALAVRRGWAK